MEEERFGAIRGEPIRQDEDDSVEDAPFGAKVKILTIAIGLIIAAFFYGLYNVDLNKPAKCAEGYICTKIQ